MLLLLRNRLRLVALFAVLAAVTGCYREVTSTQQMTWACEPGANQPTFPSVQPVCLRYVAAPSHSELEAANHLCDRLQASGKPVIEVRFIVFGDPWSGMRGYRIAAVGDVPYVGPPGPLPFNASVGTGAWGSSREEGIEPRQQLPFEHLIPRHRLF